MRIKRIKEYSSARTHKIAKKIGDSLLIIGGVADISMDLPTWGHKVLVGCAVGGKLISNWFAEPASPVQDENAGG